MRLRAIARLALCATAAALPAAPSNRAEVAQPQAQTRPTRNREIKDLARAEALLRLGAMDAAERALANLDITGLFGASVRRARAYVAFARHDYTTVLTLLDDYDLDAELATLRARATFELGGAEDAVGTLRALWWSTPEDAFGLLALRALGDLPAGSTPYSNAERRIINEVLPAAKPLGDPGPPEPTLRRLVSRAAARSTLGLESRQALAGVLIAEESFTQAIAELQRVIELTTDTRLQRAAHLRMGEATRRQGRYERALAHFERAAASASDDLAARAHAAAGHMAIEHRRYEDAKSELDALLMQDPLSSSRHEALWGLGWVAFRQGDYRSARQFFRTLGHESPFGPLASRAAYWAARALDERGRGDEARREYATLIATFPADYYAYCAQQSLRGSTAVASTLEHVEHPEVRRVRLMAEQGLLHRARRALESLTPLLSQLGPSDLDTVVHLAQELGEAPLATRATTWLHRRFPQTQSDPRSLAQLFPVALVERVAHHAERAGIETSLAVGVVRQESGFNPRAESGAGALGLMQLMPSTAAELLAEGAERRAYSRELVLRPEVSLELGTRYLGRMLRAFGHRVEYALAAYNAGPGAVTRWRQARGDLPVDIFVEEIPYAETRDYVRTVLGYRQAHRWLQSPEPRALASAAP